MFKNLIARNLLVARRSLRRTDLQIAPKSFFASPQSVFPAALRDMNEMSDSLFSIAATFPLPKRPSSESKNSFDISADISAIENEINRGDDARDVESKRIRPILSDNSKILLTLRFGGDDSIVIPMVDRGETALRSILADSPDSISKRSVKVALASEQLVQARLLIGFFNTGTLLPPSTVSFCSDEEYLFGCLGLAQDLGRYCVNRACESDYQSIILVRQLLIELNQKMLEFDFRNGLLRRRYDGLKYALKLVEDILFEGSLLSSDEDNIIVQETKRQKLVDTAVSSPGLLSTADFDGIKSRMDQVDVLREDVIKKSRDIQKLAKQAIFSIHRNQVADASAKLLTSRNLSNDIFTSSVHQFPQLRGGSFSNALEEWAEGMLLLEWVMNKRIIGMGEMGLVNATEYVGALSDFTGEIGRLGVACASRRDAVEVKFILEAIVSVTTGLVQLDCGGRFNKKVEAALTNLKKMEDIYYELVMLKKGGKSNAVGMDNQPPPSGPGGDGIDEL